MEEDTLEVREKEKQGNCSVSFINGRYIRISENLLGDNIRFFNRLDGDVLRKTCDGIFLVLSKNRAILCLVELKKTINNNFEKAIQQIEGSYLRTAMVLSLVENLNNFELAVFIGGTMKKPISKPDLDFIDRIEESRNNPDTLEAKLQEFIAESSVRMNFPFFLSDKIDLYYQKKNVAVYHLESGETFDIKKL